MSNTQDLGKWLLSDVAVKRMRIDKPKTMSTSLVPKIKCLLRLSNQQKRQESWYPVPYGLISSGDSNLRPRFWNETWLIPITSALRARWDSSNAWDLWPRRNALISSSCQAPPRRHDGDIAASRWLVSRSSSGGVVPLEVSEDPAVGRSVVTRLRLRVWPSLAAKSAGEHFASHRGWPCVLVVILIVCVSYVANRFSASRHEFSP